MTSVDDRVVNMVFNNAAFEQKIAATMGSLDKLNKSLTFPNAGKGMSDISVAAGGFHLGGMTSAIEGVSGKFLALSTIAITALATIVSHAVTAGINLGKSLSLDQVISGFKEYETNMNSIQTIMANTSADATTLEDVNGALAVLNEYSDQTIYNFGEMARNIGTFTAAGVDLDTSTNAIKGIANLAAISGSNSQQASTAMYQLSQAMASGTVKLMDWNSIVNAGMGGEIFQKALFETGKSLGTIADVPIDMTFEEWTAAGNTFRGSLEEGWLTADVLTNTLQGFTGDLNQAQLVALGYTEAQAVEMMRLGALGKAAATEVKTLTQLMGTVKESVGSGWSKSFGIIIGDFNEAKELFTGINSAIGDFVGKNADARNELLQGWKDMGGREAVIQGTKNAFEALGKILAPIKEAFREFFPATTIADLVHFTKSFERLTKSLIPSEGTVIRLKRIFEGFFAAIDIGWTVIKELAGAFKDLFSGAGEAMDGNKILAFFVRMSNAVLELHDTLVTGGGIAAFFEDLLAAIKDPIAFLEDLRTKIERFLFGSSMTDGVSPILNIIKKKLIEVRDKIIEFFKGTEIYDGLSKKIDEVRIKVFDFFGLDALPEGAFKPLERLTERWSGLKDVISNVATPPDWLTSFLDKTQDVLDDVWEAIKTWCSELGSKLAAAMKPGDFDAALDVLNVAFLGGIVAFLAKLTSGGIKFDIGDGFMKNISKSFDTLTGTLKVMQTEIKADILIKIAAAIGLLAVAVLILSLIDSEDLTKAMAAMAVGFTQLLGVMKLMDLIATGPMDAAKLAIMAGAMILMAGAMVILGLAMLIFASMSWEELAKGFAAIGIGLGLIAAAMHLMPGGVQMVLQSAALVLIGTSLTILAGAVALFALMEWDTLAKGFAAIGVGLGIIAAAMHLMPGGVQMVLQSVALNLVATSLSLLAGAVALFALMSWEDLSKGAAAVGGGLAIIAGAMHLMPGGVQMVLQAAGLVLVGIALNAIASAMLIFSTMSWEDIAKSLVAMAGALVILAAATNGMGSAIVGAVAITLVSVALGLLVVVMKEIAKMSWGDIFKALLGMVAIMGAIGLAALALQSAIGPMLLLGAAMLILGAGFALFGLGAKLVVEAFMLIAEGGGSAVSTIILFIKELIKQLPTIVKAFAEGLIDLALTLLKGAPVLIKALGVVIEHVLATIIKLAPKLAETITVLITKMLETVRALIPEVVETGFAILTGLLTGIRDNIGEIVILVADIITNFLDALALKVPEIIDSVYNLLIAIIEGVILKLVALHLYLIPKGLELIQGLLDGFAEKFPEISNWFKALPGKILGLIGNVGTFLKEKGLDFVGGLLLGILEKVVDVIVFWQTLPIKVLGWIGGVIRTLVGKGVDFIQGLWNGITERVTGVATWFTELGGKIVEWIGDAIGKLKRIGADFITGIWNGIIERINSVQTWFENLGSKIIGWVGDGYDFLKNIGKNIVTGLWNGIKSMIDWVKGKVAEMLNWLPGWAKDLLGIESPSKVFYAIGANIGQGLAIGITDSIPENLKAISLLGDKVVSSFNPDVKPLQSTLGLIIDKLGNIDEFNPTITPVLDLTQVMGEAKKLGDILGPVPVLSLALSAIQARAISAGTTRDELVDSNQSKGPTEISFVQNNHSPEALSTADIYRNTRNQIALAKEELSVL